VKKYLAKKRKDLMAIDQRKNILCNKYILEVYKEINQLMLDVNKPSDTIIEIGGAGGITKRLTPSVLISDIRIDPELDIVFKGETMPFKTESIDAIWAKDSLHHISETAIFLTEVHRVLKPGSSLYVCEPYWGPVAKFIFKFLHPEPFSVDAINNGIKLEDGNQAILYWLVDKKDTSQSLFHDLFEIKDKKVINGLSFILSGGATLTTIIPPQILWLIKKIETRSQTWMRIFGMNIYMKLQVKK
jgi:SAM-dependent methyltransferase